MAITITMSVQDIILEGFTNQPTLTDIKSFRMERFACGAVETAYNLMPSANFSSCSPTYQKQDQNECRDPKFIYV